MRLLQTTVLLHRDWADNSTDVAAHRCEQPSASPFPRQLLGPICLQLFKTTPG